MLVRLAVQLRDAGKTITQIAADLEKAKQHLHLVAAVDDLKYLRKGGRLSAAAAVAGGMLGIKPILAVIEGKVALAGKARGLPGVYVALFKKIDEMGGIHPDYTPLLGYTVNHRELQPLLTYLQDNLHSGRHQLFRRDECRGPALLLPVPDLQKPGSAKDL